MQSYGVAVKSYKDVANRLAQTRADIRALSENASGTLLEFLEAAESDITSAALHVTACAMASGQYGGGDDLGGCGTDADSE